ncbi:MAG TPA: DUF1501 domain-containing protein [Candidatus Acidoferrum sp.]|nr:DUF1501 domain-containing protein [Candidatus Acidoferrum sp.]
MNHHSRRDFMRLSCCSAAGVSLLGGLSKFGLVSALAQGATDYKALVCIFMFGGNDSNNMIVPIDSRYTGYQQARSVLALPQNQLLPLQIGNQANYALHPNMPELQSLFNNQKNLAVLSNVGTLVQPTTQQAYQQYTNLPENLYSHSDQQDQWQSAQLTGTPNAGWAGKVADKVQSSFNSAAQFPPVLSVSGSTVFSTGDVTRPFTMNPGQTPGLQGFDSSAASQARFLATQQLLTFDNGLSLVQSANSVTSQAVQYSVVLANALKNIAPLQTTFPNNYLGDQLKQVAQVIATRSALGMGRQIFFCSYGGFDTHSNQLTQQIDLLTKVSQSMAAFYQATQELGVSSQVTTFTLSEFSRTLQPGTNGGTDHAWGSHQLILGDAVKGNNVYGTFPTLALGGPDDAGNNGRWIPTTALDQYAATLATWFGVQASDLPAVFPNLANFPTSNLGFMG